MARFAKRLWDALSLALALSEVIARPSHRHRLKNMTASGWCALLEGWQPLFWEFLLQRVLLKIYLVSAWYPKDFLCPMWQAESLRIFLRQY